MRTVPLIIICVVLFLQFLKPVDAAIDSCSVSVSPTYVPPSTNVALVTFSITNSGSQTANWIKVSWPSIYYTVTNFDAGGLPATGSLENGWYIFEGGSLVTGATFPIQFEVTTASNTTSNTNWVVQISDDGGSTTTNCGGNLDVSAVPTSTPTPTPTPTSSSTSTSTSITSTSTSSESLVNPTPIATPTPTPIKKPVMKKAPTSTPTEVLASSGAAILGTSTSSSTSMDLKERLQRIFLLTGIGFISLALFGIIGYLTYTFKGYRLTLKVKKPKKNKNKRKS